MKHSTESVTNNQSTTNNPQRTTHKPDWRFYAAAAGAALAFTTGADASIIYSGLQDLQFGAGGGTFKIGGGQMRIGGEHVINPSSGAGSINLAFNYGAIHTGNSRRAVNFNPGSAIGGQFFNSAILRGVVVDSIGLKNTSGNFMSDQSGFVGFKFNANVDGGGEGWFRVKVKGDGNGLPDGAEVIDWAYNDAGGGITAGQAVEASVPEPSALGLLAIGSAGVLAWRRRGTPVTNVSKQQ